MHYGTIFDNYKILERGVTFFSSRVSKIFASYNFALFSWNQTKLSQQIPI